MPELPEVEVTRLGLLDALSGATIHGLVMGKALRWPLGCDPLQFVGWRILTVQRRGKYLWMPMRALVERAQGDGGLLWHLGMSGSLRWGTALGELGRHDHVQMQTDRGELRLTDPRRFGAVVWSPSLEAAPATTLLNHLGVEPLSTDFKPEVLFKGLAGRRISIKQALLAGHVVVGVGNIYCSEALFLARIAPQRPASSLTHAECARLVEAIQATLTAALAAGGSTLRDFQSAHGVNGNYQGLAHVYGRAGQACRVCTEVIEKEVQGQRATYFCRRCQSA
ncbi:MAG: bifunctional DNA-formamidopyrimidine glycosylase/DNA-(apurinic or apyrimidinic site) lyase [Leptothrix ochracea]|uniref:bifunctional DNA-formamidopyrimidine glycosylase/DNA-(apurinic or apyrimidinic site) lyase n=1 Tax=Leptothrix ochracea TaxID=735331 RepID=UPI0034E2DBA8